MIEHMHEDWELERELEALVSAEPSPEFLARARQRIAEELPPARRLVRWEWVAAAAAAAVVVVALAVPDDVAAPASAPAGPSTLPVLAAAPPALAGPLTPPAVSPAGARVATADDLLARAVIPEADPGVRAAVATSLISGPLKLPPVVFSESEVAAVRSLIESVRAGGPRPAGLGETRPAGDPLAVPELAIELMASPPVELAALVEGEGL